MGKLSVCAGPPCIACAKRQRAIRDIGTARLGEFGRLVNRDFVYILSLSHL